MGMQKGPLEEGMIQGADQAPGLAVSLSHPGSISLFLAANDADHGHRVPAGPGLEWCFRVWAVDTCTTVTWGVGQMCKGLSPSDLGIRISVGGAFRDLCFTPQQNEQ